MPITCDLDNKHIRNVQHWNPGPSRGWGRGGYLPRAPRLLGSPTVGQKYKIHQNVPFWKEEFKKFSSQRGPRENFGGPTIMFPRAPLWLSTGLLKPWVRSPPGDSSPSSPVLRHMTQRTAVPAEGITEAVHTEDQSSGSWRNLETIRRYLPCITYLQLQSHCFQSPRPIMATG